MMDFEEEYFGGKMTDAVHTIFGLIPREDLDVTEKVYEDARHRSVRTEWTLRRDITVEHEGEQRLLEFVYPPKQNPDGSPIEGSEVVVQSRKGEIARADSHVMAKRGVEILPSQGFLNQ